MSGIPVCQLVKSFFIERDHFAVRKSAKRREDAPRLIVKSKPNQPLEISHTPADGAGLALVFGTTEAGVANILLNSLINAASDGTPGHPCTPRAALGKLLTANTGVIGT
jgi:hypothetical protein